MSILVKKDFGGYSVPDDGDRGLACRKCGALVADVDLHDAWHKSHEGKIAGVAK